MVRVASPPTSLVRFTVIGMAGLWYLRRGRKLRQKCLGDTLVLDLEGGEQFLPGSSVSAIDFVGKV